MLKIISSKIANLKKLKKNGITSLIRSWTSSPYFEKEIYAYKIQKIIFNKFIIYHTNEEATRQTIDEVFFEAPYQFETSKKKPLIIDGGSNIGISTLFFKQVYPEAHITCFEPDPNAFKLLTLNMEVNQIKNITLINAALSNQVGKVNFYGQIHQKNPDTRGNSIVKAWGAQRSIYDGIPVPSVKLSSYIKSNVDFLKLDIEGAEELVLMELGAKLNKIKSLTIEVHQANGMEKINDIKRVCHLLDKYGFEYKIKTNDISILPEPVKKWAENVKPALFTIKANKF